MFDYPRNEEGFARALKDAEWFVNFHERFRKGEKTLWLYVPRRNPTVYQWSVVEPRPEVMEPGTGKVNLNEEVAEMARLRQKREEWERTNGRPAEVWGT